MTSQGQSAGATTRPAVCETSPFRSAPRERRCRAPVLGSRAIRPWIPVLMAGRFDPAWISPSLTAGRFDWAWMGLTPGGPDGICWKRALPDAQGAFAAGA